MGKRFDAIGLTRQFRASADKLCKGRPDMGRRIDKTLAQLLDDPDAAGLHHEPIRDTKIRGLKSSRVSQSVRLLDRQDTQRHLLALYVDHHAEAYAWARGATNPEAGDAVSWNGRRDAVDECPLADERAGAATGEMGATGEECATRATHALAFLPRAQAGEEDYSRIPLNELVALGLDLAGAARIRQARVDIDLVGYGITPEQARALTDLYLRYVTEPVASPPDRERINAGVGPGSAPTDETLAPLALPTTPAPAIPAPVPLPLDGPDDGIAYTGPGQFDQMVAIGLDRYLTTLTDDQRKLAHLGYRGPLIIKGCAGSGKTTVAVHRVRFLADQIARRLAQPGVPERRVLYLCYNRVLAEAVAQMLVTLYGRPAPRHIETNTVVGWTIEYLKGKGILRPGTSASGHGRSLRVVTDLPGRVAHCLQTSPVGDDRYGTLARRFSSAFLAAEISDLILGRGLVDEREYLDADRAGRARGLREDDRRLIWRLYEDWRAELARSHAIDMAALPAKTLDQLSHDRAFIPYEAVIVDEAQDLTPLQLRLARKLASGSPPAITILGDGAQTIYGSGFRWKFADLNPRGGQVRTLSRNHRNTVEIYAAARTLLLGGDVPEDMYVDPQPPSASGPSPILLLCPSTVDMCRAVCRRIREQLDRGVAPQNIAVLAGTHSQLEEMAGKLAADGIPHELAHRASRVALTQPSLKLLTMHSAKGLDFPHVYLLGLTEDGLPGHQDDQVEADDAWEHREMQRRLLYTAMVRAGRTLTMTTVAGREHPLLSDLGAEVRREVVRPVGVGR